MTINEVFMLCVRWAHSLSATIWVGGSLFYLLVLKPQQKHINTAENTLMPNIVKQFRGVVDACIVILIATGLLLLFDRLTDNSTKSTYVVVVTLKIVLATWMFAIARRRWRPNGTDAKQKSALVQHNVTIIWKFSRLASGLNLTVLLGIIIFFLSDLLRLIFEQGLTER